jgi:protein-S-isoprenylcysteine O-methyltransferase Ste14
VAVVIALATAAILRGWLAPSYAKTVPVLGVTAAAMVVMDLGLFRVGRNASTGLATRPGRPLDLRRMLIKCLGLTVTLAALSAVYVLVPVYDADLYTPFKQAALVLLPGVVVAAPFYIAFVDMHQLDPEDAYADLGRLVLARRPASWTPLLAHLRGWVVKGFFLPIMFGYVNGDLLALANVPLPTQWDFEHVFSYLMDMFYMIDVLLAVIAYALTLRVLDNQMRSTEPTVGGWAICLICYPPFWDGVGSHYLSYDQDGLFWGKVFAPYLVLYVLWGSVILILFFIYAWSTAAFGLRFSNLTNRGIITAGPYRWVKHPAYLSKNISWWLISVPFVPGAGWGQALQSCLLLCGINTIYYVRARTEERHLAQDATYRAYQAFIAADGLWAVLRRRAKRIAAAKAPSRSATPA